MTTLWDIKIAYSGEGRLLDRIEGACILMADTIRQEDANTPNHENRLMWAAAVEEDARPQAKQLIGRILSHADMNKSKGTDMEAVSDDTIVSIVTKVVDSFATGK
jgi:hypothetical protein